MVGCQQQPEPAPPIPERAPAPPAPTHIPAPPSSPPAADEPSLSENEVCSYVWSRLSFKLSDEYDESQFLKDTKQAAYEGNGEWHFVIFGFVKDTGPSSTEIIEKITGQWVEQQSQEVTTCELKLTAVFYEKTRTVEVVDIEKFNEKMDTEISETPILRKELKVHWVNAQYSGYQYFFEGSIENTGKIPLRYLQVEFLGYDVDGNLIAIECCPLSPEIIAVGELGHFYLRIYLKGKHLRTYDYRFITDSGEKFYRTDADSEEVIFCYEIGEEAFSAPVPPIRNYVEPINRLVRDTAVSVVGEAPQGIDANSEAWKIWQLNRWVANNINYVSDPKGAEYFTFAHQTLETKAGDCDDIAILLASLYEAVGLDAAIAVIDTDGDGEADHMACLVYWPEDVDSFLDEEQVIMDKEGLEPLIEERQLLYFHGTNPIFPAKSSPTYGEYTEGIWITADPAAAGVKDMIGYVVHEPYKVKSVVDVGN